MPQRPRTFVVLRLFEALVRRGSLSTSDAVAVIGEGTGQAQVASARRALQDIQRSKVGVVREGVGRDTRYVLVDRDLSHLNLDLRTATLDLAVSHLRHLEGTWIAESASDLRSKLHLGMDPERRALAQRLSDRIIHLPEPGRSIATKRDVVNALVQALFDRQCVHLVLDGQGTSVLHPWYLIDYRRALYLAARPDGGEVGTYPIDRIDDAEPILGSEAEDPDPSWFKGVQAGFGLHPDGPPRRVVLRFAAVRSRYVRARLWHATAQFEEDAGGVWVRMFTWGRELVRFVMEWGDKVQVIEPPELREAVIAELRGALQAYDRAGGEPSPPTAGPPDGDMEDV